MIYRWETEEERLLRFMRIPAKKKLEWLYEMNVFSNKFSSKKTKEVRAILKKR